MVINQYDVFLISLNPALGHEIKKTRSCLVLSPNEMNNYLQTIIVAPMTTQSKAFPSRVPCVFIKKEGWIALDQIRSINKTRIVKKLGKIESYTINKVKSTVKEMLVD